MLSFGLRVVFAISQMVAAPAPLCVQLQPMGNTEKCSWESPGVGRWLILMPSLYTFWLSLITATSNLHSHQLPAGWQAGGLAVFVILRLLVCACGGGGGAGHWPLTGRTPPA